MLTGFGYHSNAGSHAMFYFSVDEQCAVRVLIHFLPANAPPFDIHSTLDVVEADGTALVGNTTVHRARFHDGQRVSGSSIYFSLQYR